MFGIGWMELLFILVIALVFLGPEKMMDTARSLGKAIREVRRTTEGVTRALSLDAEERPSGPRWEPRQRGSNQELPQGSQESQPPQENQDPKS